MPHTPFPLLFKDFFVNGDHQLFIFASYDLKGFCVPELGL